MWIQHSIVKPDIPTKLTLYNRGIGNWSKPKDCTKIEILITIWGNRESFNWEIFTVEAYQIQLWLNFYCQPIDAHMWLSLRKPSMLACKFSPIFQSLKSHNSVTTQWNATKHCTLMTKWSSYIMVQSKRS